MYTVRYSFFSSVHSLIFYRVQVREHLTRDQRSFLHPESLQIFRFIASSLQFTHSSSTGFRSENTWHEIRDHSFIQNHSRSSDSQLLLFSSLTHLLQGSDQRTPDTRSETIPSSRITPDLQIHSFFSSVHSLIFYRVQVREHLTRDQRSFLHPESLQIFRFTASPLQFTSLIFYRVQIREHLTRDQRPFLHPESLQIFRFTASSLQFTHSSSTGFRSENTWHEIRDHSFIQNHSRSSDSQLLLFSSLTHLLQGSDQRTPDTRSETIPSSRITPDLQIHSFFSSVHLTHLLQGSGQRTPDTRSETIPSSRITPDLQIHSFSSSVHSLIFYRVQVREHLTRDQRPFLHPESLQIFRFTASSLQFTHSSSTGFRSENTWHEIRDHSFIQNHSRSSDSQLLLFSSPHSSSTGFRSENTWHEIRDHSFIQNHSRSSDSQLLLFSSLTHLLQGSDQRTPDTRSETIPSSRITPDLQIHSFSSSVHLTHLLQGSDQRTPDTRSETIPSSRITPDPSDSQLLLFSSPHSSSTGFRSENTWPEIRDHSFIQNHSRSSDSQLLLFSSLTHLLQGSGQRTHDTRSETIPSSRITPDLQIHSFSSSVHLTHLLQGSGQRTPDTRSETIPSSRITPDLQIHSFSSSVHSLIFYRVQIREHLTRDQRPFLHPESLQIHSFISSVHLTHLLQGSGQRTPDTRSETIPSSRISPDLQIHSFFSSVHSSSTGFRSENTWHEIIPSSRITPDLQIHSFSSSVHSLIFYRVQVREHLTRDQRPFLHPESLQIFRFTASPLQFTHSSSTGFRSENTWHEIRDHSFIQNHSRSSDSQLLLFSSPHSSSTGFRSENTWHEIRDHSFIQNHSRSSDSQLLLFSSLTHLLQGSDQRTPDTRSETIPSSRISPDSQLHLFSSPHSSSTGFRSENTWHEIRDHSFIQNLSRSSDSQLLLFSSLVFYRVQVREHLTRDHSFIQNHSRSSDSQLLLFSSLTHLLQGSGQRTPDTRSETIPSSRITPDLQIHSFFSSVHLTHLLQGSGQRTPDTGSETIPSSRITPDLQIHSFSSSVHLTHLLQGSGQRTPDTRSETIPSSRITPDLQIHSFFSSVHLTHLLQGSDQRTPDTRSETIPSSRITPDLQIHSFFSSVHLTHLLQGSGQRTPDTRSETIPSSRITPKSSDSQLLLFSSLTHLLQGSDQRTPDTRSETIPSSRITPDSQLLLFSSPHSSSTGFRSENTWHEIRDHSFIQNHSRFTASSLQFTHSSSTGFRSENTWHEIRDHSFIQNHSRSSDSQLLLFSSPHSSSTGFRSENTWHEIRDHSFIQNHSRSSDSQLLLFSSPHSSSTGFRSENTWHEIRDHSFIQNHSRSSDSQLLLFSSLTHLLQGSGQRTPDTRSETIPSSRITPDLQIHSFFSSVHSLIFYRIQVREHLTWDQRPFLHPESLQIFRFTASSLQFTHLLQGSGQRTPDTRSEIIPSSRITPDLQIHSFFSSVHSLIFYRVQVREHLTREKDAQPTERTAAVWGLSSKIDSRICVNFTRNGLRLGSRYRSSYEVF